jgi:perosamine synthetase
MSPQVKYELEIGYGTTYGLEEAQALIDCLQHLAPSCGKKVKQFEDEFAAMCGTKYALAVTSATTGLTLAGVAAGIGAGDEVITTPITWIATAAAFTVLGAKTIFCDVDERTLCMNPDYLEALITPRTKAIVPVHLYGQCCNMDGINLVANKHGIPVIEDCAHNPGGSYHGGMSGALGDMGVFSFHQQKNMSTLGEGGMVTTSNRAYYEKILSYRSLCARVYGKSDKYLSIDEEKYPMGKKYWMLQFDDIGYNFRMTDAQACVGIEQLKKLPRHNLRRIELAKRLTEKLTGTQGIILPYIDPNGQHVWHIYMIQLDRNNSISKEDFMYKLYYDKGIKA